METTGRERTKPKERPRSRARSGTNGAEVTTPHQRLVRARERLGFKGPTDAARRFHWNVNTYRSHENGARELSKKAAAQYGKAFKVPPGWLLYGEGPEPFGAGNLPAGVPLVGYLGPGGEAHFFDQ